VIPYGRQSISDADINAVVEALKGDFLTTGPLVEEFERELENFVGAPCVVVSSGTAALHCAYAAIDLKPGDEVITPPLTFIATQATATFFGAKIVFADTQKDTGNIDPAAVEDAITPRTKAIVAVDFAGHPADLDELRRIADKYSIYLIEDAAHSIGSLYRDRKVGSIADITTFSFFPTKNLTTAEGGAIASNKSELLLKARRFSRQGLVRNIDEHLITSEGPWHQEVHRFGLNYRLPDVLCALGLSQLSRLPEFKLARSELFQATTNSLKNIPGLSTPCQRSYVSPMWHLYPIRVPVETRRQIYESLRSEGIGVQVNYLPAHWHPAFGSYNIPKGKFIESENFYLSEISLPMWVSDQEWTEEYFSKLTRTISQALQNYSK
jgi:dTDP-4-amino-4,6-dideoxygalactose transaminase